MKSYFRRMNVFNFGLAIFYLAMGLLIEVSTIEFLVLLLPLFCIRFWTGKTKEELQEIRDIRRQVLMKRPTLGWTAVLLRLVLPICLGVCAYYVMGQTYEQSLFLVIGFACLAVIFITILLQPHMENEVATVFD